MKRALKKILYILMVLLALILVGTVWGVFLVSGRPQWITNLVERYTRYAEWLLS